jgi:2-oxoglutarate/2-oxoacid ferredoxin oxidoreductase subunit alpha
MKKTLEVKKDVTILFAGDSGDGIQLTGNQFTNTTALFGNDVSTFPNFPAEIRAPQGTIAGVSGFQLHFGSVDLFSPGDSADVLVVMNAAALKANLSNLKTGGTIIANSAGFDKKNLKLSGYNDVNPLQNKSLDKYRVHEIDVTKLTRTALVDSGLGTKEIDRSKNMFVLGFLYWMYSRPLEATINFIKAKFKGKQNLIDANVKVLKTGYHYGDTSETFTSRYDVKPADLPKGTYRNVMGNQATALGLIAAGQKSGLKLLYASYPITPASDILHELARHKNFGVRTFQAEDEIAAAGAAIGGAFGGALAVTASSGPGIALKTEAIGLAVMLEIPMVIINVQRGGPSTGLPTKTEQSDLFQALYGRNGEAQVAVISANSPSDCFSAAFEACKLAIEHMTPVILLSDGYMANGSEPWAFPTTKDLPNIKVEFAKPKEEGDEERFLPYKRDENLVRPWAVPGTKGLQHRVGGLEKDNETGDVSYDPDNHELMVKTRAEKITKIADFIPKQTLAAGESEGEVLVLGWGSTYGAIKTAVTELVEEGYKVAHAHLKYINPMPSNLGEILASYKKVIIPELNDAQMVHIIRSRYLIPAIPYNKIKGMPFSVEEIRNKVKEIYNQ